MPAPVLLEPPVTRWECPRCTFRDVTREAQPHTRLHTCSGLGGLTAPMVEEGAHVKVTVEYRQDYVGSEDVQLDGEGRPVMTVRTTRDTGDDIAVYAPTAHGSGRA